jgi:predicted aspartyl protease
MLIAKLSHPHSGLSVDIIGVIDTGADCSAMPAKLAILLGHDLKRGDPKMIGTGNGIAWAYSHSANVLPFNVKAAFR